MATLSDRRRGFLVDRIQSIAYRCVALFVAFASWVTHQWRRFKIYIASHTTSRWHRHREARGRRPREPRVLGVVLFQKSFGTQDDQALSRILVWAKQQGFRLCILYCPYDGIHDRIGSIRELMKWAEPYETVSCPESLKEAIGRAAGPAARMDPDMIMIFGGISSLGGFPSWSIRNSEMYDMGQLGVVTRGKLDAVLKRFTRTKQRFGR
eukprot:jgi/Picre1/28046/NNA_001006.t1